ncbi:MAG: dockerin type I repeat-containing protein [Clostridia bacterium]|nr:dockerin type I repeat-containing protein [Clostridia bacterium]
MKKSTRLISVLLAMILCLSCTSVGVFAEYADYSSPAGMNALDHPYISAYQCGSMLLDRVDEMLAEQDIHGHIGYTIDFDYDVRNIDAALSTVHTLVNHKIWKVSTSWVGDIRRLNFDSLLNAPYRTSQGCTDLQILYALFGFLRDNAERIGKLVDGEWDNGSIVGLFLDLNEKIGDVHAKIKEVVFDALIKDPEHATVTKDSTIDDMINEFLYTYIGGKDKILDSLEAEMVAGGAMSAPGVANFKLSNITVYQLLRFVLRAAIKDFGRPALIDAFTGNEDTIIPLVTGLLEIELPETDGEGQPLPNDVKVANLVDNLLDLRNGALSKFIKVTDDGVSLTPDFQTLLNQLLETAQGFMGNLTSYDTVEKWDEDGLANLTQPQMLAYLVRTVLTGLIDYMDIPKTMPYRDPSTGVVSEVPINGYGVATYALINIMADKMPEVDYFAMIENYKNNSSGPQLNPGQVPILERDGTGRVTRYVEPAAFTVLANYMYYFLNAKTTMDIPAGKNFDETLQWMFNWVIDQFGGLLRTNNLDLTTTPTLQNMVVWKNMDILLWDNVLDITWLPDDYVASFKDTSGNYTGNVTRSALLDNLLYTFVNLDMSQLNNILSLFNTYKGTISGYPTTGELGQNVIQFVLTLIKRLLNGMFQSETALFAHTQINCLEDIVSKTRYEDKTNLRWLAENLSNLIAQYGEPILMSALPIVAESLTNLDQYAENYDIFPRNNENYSIDDLRAKLEAQRPSNKLDADMMDDDDYFFFGSEDFDSANLYKYYNWREVYREATRVAEDYDEDIAQIDADTTLTAAEKTEAKAKIDYDVLVLTYRLGYYFDQLVNRNVCVDMLRREITNARARFGYGAYGSVTAQGEVKPDDSQLKSTDFTLKTWNAYNAALDFAKKVSQIYNTAPETLRQSKITAARELLVVAMKQLKFFTGAADYSALNQMKLLAKARLDENTADPTIYFQDTIADLIAAYQAAMAVDNGYDGSDQNIIDEAVMALQEAYDGCVEQPAIAKAIGSTTVIDKVNGIVYGMREKLSNYLSYIRKRGVGVLVYNLTGVGDGTGTGAEIGLTLEYEGEIVQKYTVVIFGDLDGDCRADATDANWVYMHFAGLDASRPLSTFAMQAMDANGDGESNLLDAYYLRQAGLYKYTVDQRGVA